MNQKIRHLDPTGVRAVAHPLRMQLLFALRRGGAATASQLAAKLGESSGSTSYHLRQLAAQGFVEDDPEHQGEGGRERWWRAAFTGIQVDTGELLKHPDPEVRGAMSLYLQEVAARHTLELSTWLGTMHEWSEAWRAMANQSDYGLKLTPERALELGDKIDELINSYRDDPVDAEGAGYVRIHLHLFPSTDTPEELS
ncbi:ArsR/SmtB family transcription factor [Streptomyces boninensis]|uniref:ArsR/SmtB family transcription factor n=1 Tax=Streptomyces boninensis TaxID=2039455 RepID=UPI003B21FF3F